MRNAMTLYITVPSHRLGEWTVSKVVARGVAGSFCMLPRHIDFVSVLQTGILTMELVDEEEDGSEGDPKELFAATDSGVLVKRGQDVYVSVRRAVVSRDLEQLRDTVREEFAQRDELEVRARSAASKLEVGFVRRFMELEEGLHGR
jgi:F-type H+-transporting ATPase subunit epsilon